MTFYSLLPGISSRDMGHRSINGKLAPRVVNRAGQIGRNDTNVIPGRTRIKPNQRSRSAGISHFRLQISERGHGSSEVRGQGRQAYRQRGQTDTRHYETPKQLSGEPQLPFYGQQAPRRIRPRSWRPA